MTDYVLENYKELVFHRDTPYDDTIVSMWSSIYDYANFLKQPPKLGDFIPCDKEGKPLEKPDAHKTWRKEMGGIIYLEKLFEEVKDYKEALERVLFEGFEVEYDINGCYRELRLTYKGELIYINSQKLIKWGYKTIEDLTTLGLTLTKNATK